MEALAGITCDPPWVAFYNGISRYVFCHHGASGDESVFTDLDAAEDNGPRPDGSPLADESGGPCLPPPLDEGPGSEVVGENRMGANENTVFDGDFIPYGDAIFDGHAIADDGA